MSITYDVLKDDVRAGRPIDFGFVTYVPERTCHDTGARKVFFVCSDCGEAYRKDSMRLWHHKPWSYCPRCGARVVEVSDDDRR